MHTRFAMLPFVVASAIAQQPPQFDAPRLAVGAWSRIDELVDLDLDGDLDGFGIYLNQMTSSQSPSFLKGELHRNDGTGRFTTSLLFQWAATPGEPTNYLSAVGDVDGDGHADLVTIRGNEIWIVESRPGQPTVRTLTPLPLSLSLQHDRDMRLADVTGDGRCELFVVDTLYGLRAFNLGATNYTQRGSASPAPSSTELAVLDANGDGLLDAAVVDGGIVRLYPGTQLGYFAPFASFVLPVGVSSYGMEGELVAGDVDGDQDVDLVVFGQTGIYAWIERTGPNLWNVHGAAVGGPATHLCDVDGDGDLDGACCGGGGGPSISNPNYLVGQFEIAQNLGGGVFAPSWTMPSIGPFHLAGCADLDGDGRPDLVGGRCIWSGQGRHDPVAAGKPSAFAVMPHDRERDGDPDVFDFAGNLWRNRGDGVLQSQPLTLPTLPAGSTWLVRPGPIDFDADGAIDLFAWKLTGGAFVAVHWLANAGGGLYVDRGPVLPPGVAMMSTEPMFGADFDGDGDLDVLQNDGQTSLLIQSWWQSAGQLVAGPTWTGQRVIAVADFTQDGRPDALLASYPSGMHAMDLSLLTFPSGQAPVVTPLAIPTTLSLDSPGVVDEDGDGDLDLVLYEATATYQLRVFRNDGTGGFSGGPVLVPAVLKQRARVAVADVDGDGRFDCIAGPLGLPEVNGLSRTGTLVVRQLAAGQFDASAYSTEFGWPADADGDGDLDLIGTAVMRNTKYDGAAAGVREQFGAGSAGTGGGVPTLGATGPFRPGFTMHTILTGGLGQGFAFLAAGLAPATPPIVVVPNFTVYLDSPFVLAAFVLDGTGAAAGEGSADFPLFLPPAAAGFEFWQQAFVFDPAGNTPQIGVVHTQALRCKVGW